MLKHDSKHKRLGWFLFIVYLLLVIYLMFFSEELGRTAHESYSYNLELFKAVSYTHLDVYKRQPLFHAA